MSRAVPSLMESIETDPRNGQRYRRVGYARGTGEAAATARAEIAGAWRLLAQLEAATAGLRQALSLIESEQRVPAAAAAPIPEANSRVAYRIAEAAALLGVSAATLRREVQRGTIPARVNGRIIIISQEALNAYARGGSQ